MVLIENEMRTKALGRKTILGAGLIYEKTRKNVAYAGLFEVVGPFRVPFVHSIARHCSNVRELMLQLTR